MGRGRTPAVAPAIPVGLSGGPLSFLRSDILADQLNQAEVAARAAVLEQFHNDPDDCRAVAEAEAASLPRLLTFDRQLIARLSGHARVALIKPSAYWRELDIPSGTPPAWTPHPTNPLSSVTWWHW